MNFRSIFFIALVVCVTFLSVESSKTKNSSLMDAVRMVLIDPEFLALSDIDQVRVLEAIYAIVEDHLNTRMGESNVKSLSGIHKL